MPELTPGSEFAGYRIEGAIGRGGMGVVYRAVQVSLDRMVALKIIVPELAQDEGFRERFKRESRTAASIEHPHVVPVHEAGEHHGVLYISMRYIDGTDLRELLRSQGRMEPQRAARIIAQVASALDAAHARGLVHRDVKPANILLAAGAGEDHAYLTDFGLTKHVSSAAGLTGTGQFVGTLDYIAPEQIQGGTVDARADVYALGCVLYELLAGRTPFARDSDVAKLWAHMNDAPPPLDAGQPLEDVVRRAMAKRPDDRFPSAGDLGRAALAAAEGQGVAQPERSVATGEAAPSFAAAPAQTLGAAPAATFPGAQAPHEASTNVLPPAPPQRSGNRAVVTVLAALLLVAVGVGLALALGGGGDGGGTSSADSTQASTDTGGADGGSAGPVTRAEALQLGATYADYFTDENLGGIEEIFTPDFKRLRAGATCSGLSGDLNLDQALEEYQCQFEKLELPEYKLQGARIRLLPDGAIVRGRYSITDKGAPAGSGGIQFQMVRTGDKLKISQIALKPDG